jgi:hypothetical protein
VKYTAVFFLLFLQNSWANPRCEFLFKGYATAREFAQKEGIQEQKDFLSQFLWNKYLKKWDPSLSYTDISFEKRIEQSYKILQTLKIRQGLVDSYYDQNWKRDEVAVWAEKEILREGLKGYFFNVPQSQALPQKVYNQVQRVLHSKVMRAALSIGTLSLPNLRDRQLPYDLLSQVMVDGIDPHYEALRRAYNITSQNRIDNYRVLRSALRSAMLAISAVITFQQFELKQEQQQLEDHRAEAAGEVLFQQQMRALDEMSKRIDEL